MGSGTKNRKGNDVTLIRRPKMPNSSGGAMADIAGTAATVCIPSFDQKVTKSPLTRTGVKVRLQKNGEKYSIMIGSNVASELNQKYSSIITDCGAMGIKYSGEIIEKNNGVYARFDRISR